MLRAEAFCGLTRAEAFCGLTLALAAAPFVRLGAFYLALKITGAIGADAVVAMRFSSGSINPGTIEMLAYGTAVKFV